MGETNVSEPITMQKLISADIDVDTLGEAVNADKMITSRKGLVYPSAPMATRLILEQGTIDATIFATRAVMEASVLLDNAYALVTDDSVLKNNGYYQKKGGIWVYLKINPYVKIDSVNKTLYGNAAETRETPAYTLKAGHFDPQGTLQIGTVGFQYSSDFLLKSGETITLGYYGTNFSPLVKKNAGVGYTPIEFYNRGYANQKKTLTYTAQEDVYIAFSSATDFAMPTVKVEVKSSDNIIDIVNATKDAVTVFNEPELLDVTTSVGGLLWQPVSQIAGNQFSAIQVQLSAGDVLTFDAYPLTGTNLWDWRENQAAGMAWPLISQTATDGFDKSYSYTAIVAMTVRIVAAKNVRVNGGIPTYTDLGVWAVKNKTLLYPQFTQLKTTALFDIKAGDTVYIDKAAKDANSIARKDNITGELIPIFGSTGVGAGNINIAAQWTADADVQVVLSGFLDATFRIKRADSDFAENMASLVQKINSNESSGGDSGYKVPSYVTLPPKEYVFATAMNYILKTEKIGATDYIKISTNLGKTWTQMPNILGDIVSYHFFSDGTIMLCSPTKVYWTDDYLTLNESTVYDHDGSVFVPTSRHFFCMQTGDKIDFVGDTEIYSWGDYHVDRAGVRIWYTTDNGRTIKCAALFGTTLLGGVLRSVRHVHRVYYHAKTNYFYITTGDDGTESMIIRARYDVLTDTWVWKILNAGPDYKFGNIMIDDNNIAFMITDYTEPSQAEKKGIYRVHATDLGDITKYRLIYKCEPSEWGSIAPISLSMDNNGNKVLYPDYLGAGFLWIARDGLDFEKVVVSQPVLLTYMIGENYRGDIWCVAYEGGNNLRLNSGSYNLTKALRNAGMANFMRGTKLVSGLTTAVS